MIRSSRLYVNEANSGKLQSLQLLLDESLRVLNLQIDNLWTSKSQAKFYSEKVDTWLSARLQQALGKQACAVLASQRKKRRKTKPIVRQRSITLDSRFVHWQLNVLGAFDCWLKLSSLGNKLSIKLPLKQHAHLLGLMRDGFKILSTIRLIQRDGRFAIDMILEKNPVPLRPEGNAIGIDVGVKKLLACSTGETLGVGLEELYKKIQRRRPGSVGFTKARQERRNTIHRICNSLDLSEVSRLVCEDLKNVKRGTRRRLRKEFRSRLQRWTYPEVLEVLRSRCERAGILFVKVNPRYTSQTCSLCGHVDRNSRKGEQFRCTCCRMEMDADINAAVNILHRGAYSPPASQQDQ